MAGEEIFTANAIISVGTAFFFLTIYIFYENKGIRNILKPIFFIAAIIAIINGWHGQSLAYKVQSLYAEKNYIENFWIVGLNYLLYGLILAVIIDLAFITYQNLFSTKRGESG